MKRSVYARLPSGGSACGSTETIARDLMLCAQASKGREFCALGSGTREVGVKDVFCTRRPPVASDR